MDIGLKLQNVELHNKLNQTRKQQEEFNENSKKLIQKYMTYLKKYQEEIQKLTKEKQEIEEKYYAIPKFIRKIFE